MDAAVSKATIGIAVTTIERAVNGMAGASGVGDVAYATERRAIIGTEAEKLRGTGIDVDGLLAKADQMVVACQRRDMHAAYARNIEIGDLLAPLCD